MCMYEMRGKKEEKWLPAGVDLPYLQWALKITLVAIKKNQQNVNKG